MRYLPLTDSDRREMLKTIGISHVRDLFKDIPADKILPAIESLPSPLPENELIADFADYAARNKHQGFLSFQGGGAYNHYIPEVVRHLSGKGEFLTPYTPYQPEVSQGSLQAMFEYQTMICMLTGLDVANSSLYDGGTAAVEALLLAARKSRKQRFLVAESIHPEYREIMSTYLQNLDIEMVSIPFDPESGKVNEEAVKKNLDQNTAGLIFQSPNFFGIVEESAACSNLIHEAGGFSVQLVSEAMSMPYLVAPGENHVDIVAGEAQSFGLPLSFGGPYLGFLAAREPFLRQIPGRLVGETADTSGRRGYVLTLSTREQHIKREKATSNICTNQAWCALRAAMYLSTMGKKGLSRIAEINHQNTVYFARKLDKLQQINLQFPVDYFNEVVITTPTTSIEFLEQARRKGILAGIPMSWFYPDMTHSVLVAITEMHKPSDIDRFIEVLGEIT